VFSFLDNLLRTDYIYIKSVGHKFKDRTVAMFVVTDLQNYIQVDIVMTCLHIRFHIPDCDVSLIFTEN